MLSPLQETLLNDLNKANAELSLYDLYTLNPKYTEQIVSDLVSQKLINQSIIVTEHSYCGGYSISETGKAELLLVQQARKKEAEEKAEKKADRQFQRKMARQSALWGAFAGAVVNLLFDHASDLPQLVRNFFQFLSTLFR